VVLIGHRGHPEVEGTMGQYSKLSDASIFLVESPADVAKLEIKNPETVAFVTQTTLSVDDTAEIIEVLRKRFPALSGPRKEDICYATQNRQDAVKSLVAQCDVILVVGSPNSSNSNRLREIAEKNGKAGFLVDGPADLKQEWFSEDAVVGVTAGASAPELLVRKVIDRLIEWGGKTAEEQTGREENIVFTLPKVLRNDHQTK
jgi:4-hydroxy-3-methylbut-2-enyl diphosphate reductase